MTYLQRHGFQKNDDGTYTKAVFVIETIDELMEHAIIDVKGAKGPGHLETIVSEVKKSLDIILGDDEVSKDYCVRFLQDPDDIFLLNEIQRRAPNQDLKLFANNYGYEEGIKSITS